MKNLLLILFVAALAPAGFGQDDLIYEGKQLHSTYYPTDSDKGFKKYNKRKLTLRKDSTFTYYATYVTNNAICIGCIDTLWVTGKWGRNNDTLVLNSDYKSEDFVQIFSFESKIEKSTIVYNTAFYCHDRDKVVINRKLEDYIDCAKAKSFDVEGMETIKFKKYKGTTFLYEYECQVPKSFNLHTINIKDKILKNDFFISNFKFVEKDGQLILLESHELFETEDGFKLVK